MKVIRILIVEDSEDDAFFLIHHLRKANYDPVFRRVESEEEMEQALVEPWDIVIADQSLPLFSGWAALELLKRKGLDIPFLLVSGVVPEEAGAALMSAGAHDCMMKNRLARLGPVVDRALREAELKKQRKLAAEALEKTEQQYRRLVEVCPDCILIVDGERVVFVNPAGLVLFGARTHEDLTGASLRQLFDGPSHTALRDRLQRTVSPGEPQLALDYRIVRVDGSIREVEIAVASFQGQQGELLQLVLRDVSDRRRLEREVIRISEHEQQSLGQDLHDGLCQKLIALKFRISVFEASLQDKGEKDDASSLSKILEMAIHEAHSLAYGLCPVAIDRKGLVSALRDLAKTTETIFGVKCRVRARGTAPWVDSQLATQLFRIAQESITNAIKHGKATHIAVGMTMDAKGARLNVSDNGRGFGNTGSTTQGMGVKIMQYRAQCIGARFRIEAREPQGTCIVCECSAPPVSSAAAAA